MEAGLHVQVAAADSGEVDFHEDIVVADLWYRDILKLEVAAACLRFDERSHVSVHPWVAGYGSASLRQVRLGCRGDL